MTLHGNLRNRIQAMFDSKKSCSHYYSLTHTPTSPAPDSAPRQNGRLPNVRL